jgi:hypothetical protein
MKLIEHYKATGNVSSISFATIPSTYTDLYLVLSLRYSGSDSSSINVKLNGTTAGYTGKSIRGNGSGVISFNLSTENIGGNSSGSSGASQTVNAFGSSSLYIPNYLSTTPKPITVNFTQEANVAAAFMGMYAALWSDNTPISNMTIAPDGGTFWVANSTATLYGIRNN